MLWFIVLISTPSYDSQFMLNLNEWLQEFSDCHVAIIVIGNESISVGNFEYPIRLRTSTSFQRFNYTNSIYRKFQPRFCTLEVSVISKLTVQTYVDLNVKCPTIQSYEEQRFICQYLLYPHLTFPESCLSVSGLTDENTNSFSFNVVVLPTDVNIPPKCLFQLNPANKYYNDQHFSFNYTTHPNRTLQIISGHFYKANDMLKNYRNLDFSGYKVRQEMQKAIHQYYQRGRDLISSLNTWSSPPNMLELRNFGKIELPTTPSKSTKRHD